VIGAPPDPVLDVRDLHAGFAERGATVAAVRGVSFTLRRGEKLAIVGESGCGKSTLALALLGLLDPPGRVASGSVRLNGRLISGLGDRAMGRIRGREMSFIYQDPMGALDPIRTIGEQIGDTIRRHQPQVDRREARRLAASLLSEVEVPAAGRRLDDYPHQYSGGMRQRVLIAMALANDPSVVIADEPTTALDVTTQAQVLALLDRVVAGRGVAIVLITHNLGVVADFCDSVQVMYAGRIVEAGRVEQVLSRPVHPYTEALLAAIPRPDVSRRQRLPAIPGAPPDLAALPPGCSFEPRCRFGSGRAICVTQPPATEAFDDAGAPGFAECHFARERHGAPMAAALAGCPR
jgi:oligopeptide/dipeptide ABC transporter ATP-binding protein